MFQYVGSGRYYREIQGLVQASREHGLREGVNPPDPSFGQQTEQWLLTFWFTHMVDMREGIDVRTLQHIVLPDHAVAVCVRLVGFLR
jgi:hypothetical protein